jgi:hypothetical protein
MAATYKGKFTPINPKKYSGDPNNIIFRSKWEYDVFKILDRSDDVVFWGSEEFNIRYYSPVDKRGHRYYPDLIYKTKSGRTYVVEIKPYKQTIPPPKPARMTPAKKRRYIEDYKVYAVNKAKWEAAEAFCEAKGFEFKLLTEKTIYGSK